MIISYEKSRKVEEKSIVCRHNVDNVLVLELRSPGFSFSCALQLTYVYMYILYQVLCQNNNLKSQTLKKNSLQILIH